MYSRGVDIASADALFSFHLGVKVAKYKGSSLQELAMEYLYGFDVKMGTYSVFRLRLSLNQTSPDH